MKQYGWIERIAGAVDLQDEAMPGQPIVELFGDGRLLIEHHRGVTEYGRERICVRVRYGSLRVCGCRMELARMTADQLVITGRIDSVTLDRRR
ncbi:MAG: YabP/YqfC family sporulation protein [Oscillospiraceae bacterium]|nr:YabP/YqfC family sporulation protein [Oscillospiraceae bacterium]